MELAAAPGLRHQGRLAGGRAPTRPTTRLRFERAARRRPRTTCPTACASRSSVRPGPAARVRARARGARAASPTRPSGRTPCGSPPTGSGCPLSLQAGSRRRRALGPARSPRRCSRPASGWSGTRSPACVAHPTLVPLLAELTPEHFDLELHRRVREHLLEPASRPTASSSPSLAELDARAARGGDRRGDRQGAAAAAA